MALDDWTHWSMVDCGIRRCGESGDDGDEEKVRKDLKEALLTWWFPGELSLMRPFEGSSPSGKS